MSDKRSVLAAVIIGLGLLVVWGCQGQKPLAPAKPLSLTVSIPVNDSLKASLLGSTTNEVIYVVGKNGITLLKGNTGTFSSSTVTGSVNFTFNVPTGSDEVLSVQLNDGTTHQPLAVGAMPLDLSAGGSDANVSIQLGSVDRHCYNLTNAVGTPAAAYTFGFDGFSLLTQATAGIPYDTAFEADSTYTASGNYLVDAEGNTGGALFNNSIAYLGNGDLADFDYVPGAGQFYVNSWLAKYYAYYVPVAGSVPKGSLATPPTDDVEAGDVYCIALNTIPGGHAWVQIVNPGIYNVSAPSIRYRVNKALSYFQYYQTTADVGGTACYAF